MEIIPEPEWDGLFNKLLSMRGSAMIMGETDSGKSTLAKYLIKSLVIQNTTVCLIDADVGQSSLGLPGAICTKTFSSERDLQSYAYEKMSFVGTVNPANTIAHVIATVNNMFADNRNKSDIIIIDTSGLVAGEMGKKLKIGKIKALNPAHIIALQKENELEHILRLISGMHIYRINVSNNIKARPLATRIQYRKKKYDDYFQKSEMNDFSFIREMQRSFTRIKHSTYMKVCLRKTH